ncbi:hypothetical protein PG997_010665 [Apiospora hydei]|uniref:F-box domain-containing protein n=1 Tax=Apiospora hydei TaxID=1337664 RepID=A0ABR1VHV7_9PEZI
MDLATSQSASTDAGCPVDSAASVVAGGSQGNSSSAPDDTPTPPHGKVFKTAELRTMILDHLSASDVAALRQATRVPLNKEDARKFLNPLRDLGPLHDAIVEFEKSGVRVILVGKGIKALQDSIRRPADAGTSPKTIVLGLMFEGLIPCHLSALRHFFSRLHCYCAITFDFLKNEHNYTPHTTVRVPSNSGPIPATKTVLMPVTSRVKVMLPKVFTHDTAIFYLTYTSGLFSYLADITGESNQIRMGLEVVRASSMWRSVALNSDVEDDTFTVDGVRRHPNLCHRLSLSFTHHFHYCKAPEVGGGDYAFGLGSCLAQW